ncbi:PAS domain S-box protein [Deinococcus cavernae]|uniref:PAS domain S-box protein n=1 Tax=Deinococcus cavernae TaxID=2320857 RepID=A0A418VBC4_9DEIO|nr:PAS domain-containing protein [Deinococcus cavernae]RJF73326.1 PAS domain S-box protein [Deinococcus cavernae]
MRSGGSPLTWQYVIFGLLLGIDVLVGLRVVKRLVLHQGEISPDAPFFVLLLLVLQVSLLLVFAGWKSTLRHARHLREAYEREVELSQQIMESVEMGVSVLDAEGRYHYLNRAACELLGISREALLGKTAEELVTGTGGLPYQEMAAQSLVTTRQMPVTLRRSDGQLLRALVKVTPRWYEGRVVGFITSVVPCGDLPQEPSAGPSR